MLSDCTLTHKVWDSPPLWSAGHWGVIDRHGVITHAELWLATDSHFGDVIAPDFFSWLFAVDQLEIPVNADLYLAQNLNLASLRNTAINEISPSQNWWQTAQSICCPEQISLTLYQVMRKSKWTLFTFLRALFYIQYQWGLIIWKPFSATEKKNLKRVLRLFFLRIVRMYL